MGIENIVQVNITNDGRGVRRQGFGIALVLAKHVHTANLTKQYSMATALSDMVADGFETTEPAYRAVSALGRNTPKPRDVIVGKLLTTFDHTFNIGVRPITAVGGELYEITMISPSGVVSVISYTALPADDEDDIALALQTQLDAMPQFSAAAPVAGVIACAADNSNKVWLTTGLDAKRLTYEDSTLDSNLAAELGNIQAQNNDWHSVYLADAPSAARLTAVANYIETQEKIHLGTTHDTACGDSGSSGDIAATLNAAAIRRTALLYSSDQGQHGAATWIGNRTPFDPGSQTWAYKPLSGVQPESIETDFAQTLENKRCNYYTSIGGLSVTNGGESVGGTMAGGEYIDVIRGIDWLVVRLRERIFGLLANVPKVPYTTGGIDQIGAEVDAQLREGISAGLLSPDPLDGEDGPPFIVTLPQVADVPKADKIARVVRNVNFEAGLAGAVHATVLNGAISV